MRRPTGNRWALLLIVAVGVLTLCAACGGSGKFDVASRPPDVLASLPEGKLLVHGALVSLQDYRRVTFAIAGNRGTAVATSEGAISPDGKYIAYSEGEGRSQLTPGPNTAVVIRQTSGIETFRLPLSTTAVSAPVWSPRGDLLAFQVDTSVYIVAGATGERRSHEVPPGAWGVSWLADSSSLFFEAKAGARPTNDRTRFFRMDASSGAWSELFLPPGAYPGFNFSPDGKYYTYAIGECHFYCDLWLVEQATGRTCLIMKNAPAKQYPPVPRWSPDGRWLTYFAQADFHTVGTGELRVFDPVSCKDEMGLKDVLQSVWSPDGRNLAITTKTAPDYSQHLHLWHPGGVVQSLDVVVSSLVWSPDSANLAAVTTKGLTFIDVLSGVTADVPLGNESGSELFWSPSGRYVVISRTAGASLTSEREQAIPTEKKQGFLKFTPSPGATRIEILDRQNGKITVLVDEAREYRLIAWVRN